MRAAGPDRCGEVVILSGERGSGRPELLRAFADALARQRPAPTVIGGRFTRDRFDPWPSEPATRIPFKQIVTLVGTAMPLAKELVQLTEFIGEVVQCTAVGWDTINVLHRQHPTLDSGHGLVELLRAATRKGPMVVVLDDFDQVVSSMWTDILLDRVAPAITTNLPVFLVIGIDAQDDADGRASGASSDGPAGSSVQHTSELTYTVDRLIRRFGARDVTIAALGPDEIAAWLGRADGDLVRQLHAVTGGNPGRLWELWQDWERRGVVKRAGLTRRWRFAVPLAQSPADATHDLISQILDERLERLLGASDRRRRDELKDILAHAALEGHEFTVEAVARVLGRDGDELVARLADITHDRRRPDGVIHPLDPLTIHDPRSGRRALRRHAFTSDLFRYTLLRGQYGLSDAERPKTSLALASALVDLYSPDEHRVARTLARLFRAGGDEQSATRYQRVADFHPGAHVESLRQQAMALMAASKERWEPLDTYRATALLLEAGRAMLHVYPYDESLAVFDAAYALACETGNPKDQARVLFRRGYAQRGLGQYDPARTDLRAANELFTQLANRWGEGATWHALGELGPARGRLLGGAGQVRAVARDRSGAVRPPGRGRRLARVGRAGTGSRATTRRRGPSTSAPWRRSVRPVTGGTRPAARSRSMGSTSSESLLSCASSSGEVGARSLRPKLLGIVVQQVRM